MNLALSIWVRAGLKRSHSALMALGRAFEMDEEATVLVAAEVLDGLG